MTNQRDAAEAVARERKKIAAYLRNFDYSEDALTWTPQELAALIEKNCHAGASLPAATEQEPVAYRYIVHTPDGKKRALTAHKCTHWDGYPISDETALYDRPAPSDQEKLVGELVEALDWYASAVAAMTVASDQGEKAYDALVIDAGNRAKPLITRARQIGEAGK